MKWDAPNCHLSSWMWFAVASSLFKIATLPQPSATLAGGLLPSDLADGGRPDRDVSGLRKVKYYRFICYAAATIREILLGTTTTYTSDADSDAAFPFEEPLRRLLLRPALPPDSPTPSSAGPFFGFLLRIAVGTTLNCAP